MRLVMRCLVLTIASLTLSRGRASGPGLGYAAGTIIGGSIGVSKESI